MQIILLSSVCAEYMPGFMLWVVVSSGQVASIFVPVVVSMAVTTFLAGECFLLSRP